MPLPVPPQVSLVCVLLFVLLCPEVVVVSVNLSFLPVVVVVQLLTPFVLVNVPPEASHCLWLGEAANAGSARAKVRSAVATNIVIVLIICRISFPSFLLT